MDLYGRDDSVLFPPPGIDAGDSFFSSFAREGNGELARGKRFVGVYTANIPSMQTTQVRAFASLLQSPAELPESEQDPWWTLLGFFNSFGVLGNTKSLAQHDIHNYLRAKLLRSGTDWSKFRYITEIMELTGRLPANEIKPKLDRLEVRRGSKNQRAVDLCLATSMIEVGIDIPRLALMVVVGQPKTTSQYIQVTGRVGRLWQQTPGLIVTLYGIGNPRDRSHFEKFRSYHERLYANVEPTSVTPFAPPVLERALRGCLIGFVRQHGDPQVAKEPYPFPEVLAEQFKSIILDRVSSVDPNEMPNLEEELDKWIARWKNLQRTEWGSQGGIPLPNALMAGQGSYVPSDLEGLVWPIPTSLRNVDAACEMIITRLYARELSDG